MTLDLYNILHDFESRSHTFTGIKRITVRSEESIGRESATLELCSCVVRTGIACDEYILIISDLEHGILKHKHVSLKEGVKEIIRISKTSDYVDITHFKGSRYNNEWSKNNKDISYFSDDVFTVEFMYKEDDEKGLYVYMGGL